MKKEELIKRIIDTFTDMGSEDPTDAAECNYITFVKATEYLAERREMEIKDLEPSERLPEEVTPLLYMEAFNCYIRKCRYEVTVKRLAEYFTDGELVYTYLDFQGDYHNDSDMNVLPTDFLNENMEFPFTQYDLTMLDLIMIGKNSYDFSADEEFCWYDNNQLHTTDTPFADGLLDAEVFAKWILEDNGRIEQIQNGMDNTQIDYVFRYWG